MSRWLTTSEIAAELKITPQTVRYWCKAGYLPAARVGRNWRVHKDDFAHWLARKRAADEKKR